MTWCTWTKPTMKSRKKPTKRCGMTKTAARAAVKRAFAAGKGAGMYKKGKKTASRKRRC